MLCQSQVCTVVCDKLLRSCLTLYDPVDCSPPGLSVHGTLQARILGRVVMLFSRKSSWPRDQTHVTVSPASAGRFFTTSATWEAQFQVYNIVIQYFYALQNDHHNKSSYPLSLYKVIILLLAIFSMLDKPGCIEHQLALMSWFYRLKKNKKPKNAQCESY